MSLGLGLIKPVIFWTLLMGANVAQARSIEGVDFADSVTVGSTKLLLNGVGLRSKRVVFNIRVYVGGLYVVKPTHDGEALIHSDDPRHLRMVFLRSLDKATLVEAFQKGFNKNCKTECEEGKVAVKGFNNLITDVKEGDEWNVDYLKDGVDLEIKLKGKDPKTGSFKGAAFSRDLLGMFIGPNPASEDLKKGLLGN